MLITFVTGFKVEIKSQANFQLRFWLTRNYSGEDDLIKSTWVWNKVQYVIR